jgi:hypothetical protein
MTTNRKEYAVGLAVCKGGVVPEEKVDAIVEAVEEYWGRPVADWYQRTDYLWITLRGVLPEDETYSSIVTKLAQIVWTADGIYTEIMVDFYQSHKRDEGDYTKFLEENK